MERRGATTTFQLEPLHQISLSPGGNATAYISHGDDPYFALACSEGVAALRPGWYLLQVRMGVQEGFLVAPCLYADWGSGVSEETRIDLPEPDADGWIRAVVVVPSRPRFLRFDPTIHPAHFTVHGFTLRRISRVGAALRMLSVLARTSAGGRRHALSQAWTLLASRLRGRSNPAAQRLVDRYLASHRRSDRGYAQWLELFEPEVPPVSDTTCAGEAAAPAFSIVLPVFNTPPQLLQACVESVIAQSYPHWQLCIADDASTHPDVRRLLESYRARDPRIDVVYGDRQAHISGNTNRALALASGRYVGFLDHDDELAPDALEEVASAIARFPQARLFYSDEDKIDEDGSRHSPHFKPAWNPDLLRSLNYVAHFMVVEAGLLRDLGGVRAGFEGAQDHDLALRCSERLTEQEVVHIPRVLYHWRTVAGSTALGVREKPYVLEAGRRAILEHLQRTDVQGDVQVLDDGRYRIERALPASVPRAVIVIPTRDRVDLLSNCVDSVLRHSRYPDFEIVIVDNGSIEPATHEYLRQVADHPKVSVLHYAAPFNFSDIVNHGVQATRGSVICLMNNDIEAIRAGWLYEMVAQACRPEVGVVGAMLYYPDDTIQHAGVILGIGGVAGHSHCRLQRGADGYISRARVVQNLTAVTAACMVFRREVFDHVGGFDDVLAVAFNDVDFCMRVRAAGYLNVWTPFAELYHHESASRGAEDTPAKQARFARETQLMKQRWGNVLASDPSYNPNLSLDSERFELAFPPRRAASRTGRLPQPAAA